MKKEIKTGLLPEIITSDNAAAVLTVAAVIASTLLFGAYDWYFCLIPSALLVAAAIIKHTYTFKNRYGFIFLIMTASAAISLYFGQTDKQNGIYGLELIMCFFAAFYAGSAEKNGAWIKKYIFAAAFLTAAIGLAAYAGIIRAEEFVISDHGIRRLQSVFRYANTAAVVLGCGYYLSLDISESLQSRICSVLTLLAMYLTFSRAAIVIFICIGTALAFLNRSIAKRVIIDNGICLVLAAALFAFYLYSGRGGYALSETMVKRFVYMRDALAALRAYPIIGAGSCAWRYLQYSLQSTGYSVAHIHNGWLEHWLENGIIFTLCLLVLTAASVYRAAKAKDWSIAASILLIALHSLVDFDMSFGSVLVIYALMLGQSLKNGVISRPAVFVNGFILLLVCASVIYAGAEYTVRSVFEKSYTEGNTDRALKKAYTLRSLCPCDSSLRVSIAALDGDNAASELKEARRLSPLDPEIMRAVIEYKLGAGGSGIIEDCITYISMAPKQENVYALADIYASRAFENGLCSQEKYNSFREYTGKRRISEGVTDRNALLEDMVKQKENTK